MPLCQHCGKTEALYVVRYMNRRTCEPAGEDYVCGRCADKAERAQNPLGLFEAHVSRA